MNKSYLRDLLYENNAINELEQGMKIKVRIENKKVSRRSFAGLLWDSDEHWTYCKYYRSGARVNQLVYIYFIELFQRVLCVFIDAQF